MESVDTEEAIAQLVGSKQVLALAAAIWHNYRTGAADKRSLIAYDH